MRTRHRPNSREEAGVRKWRQPMLLTTPAERHQGEEREKEHGHGDVHSCADNSVISRVCNHSKLGEPNNGPQSSTHVWRSPRAGAGAGCTVTCGKVSISTTSNGFWLRAVPRRHAPRPSSPPAHVRVPVLGPSDTSDATMRTHFRPLHMASRVRRKCTATWLDVLRRDVARHGLLRHGRPPATVIC